MRDFTGVSGATDTGLAKLSPDPATRWTPEVANSIVQELCHVVTSPVGGNTAIDPDDDTQLLAAIRAMIAGAFPVTVNGNGRCIDYGTHKIQMGEISLVSFSSSSVNFDIVFPVPFATECWHIGGNPAEGAQFGWGAMTTVYPTRDRFGATGVADAANASRNITNGKIIRWFAIGDSAP